jgi:hypothetical protein
MKKKIIITLCLLIALALGAFVATFNPASLVASRQGANDELIADKMAEHIGVLAYLYGYPLVDVQRQMHFPAGQMPPVNGFWSLSVYNLDENFSLAPNKIGRYSIGDRTKGINYNDDGSLTIYLQHGEPGESLNWLPTPAGNFMAVMRLYEPAPEALSNAYLLPRIEEIRD